MKAIIESLKGYDGQYSSRRIFAFCFLVLTTIAVLSLIVLVFLMLFRTIVLNEYSIRTAGLIIDLLYILCAMILLLLSVITMQQIINFRTANPTPPPIVENAENVNVDNNKPNENQA